MEEMKNQDMIALLLAHRSVREFTAQPVTEETIDTIVACAQQAPTSSYLQAYGRGQACGAGGVCGRTGMGAQGAAGVAVLCRSASAGRFGEAGGYERPA